MTIQDNTRIAKNTIFLYFRMIFIMAVSLYTSRIVLDVLGVEDYGIYNVVGGIVAMFGVLNVTMSSTTQRYMSFALGRNDFEALKRNFSTCILTHLLIAIIVVALVETVGLWFLYNKMVIPPSRMNAAFWVLQCATASTAVVIMSVPFNADIIAHEKMSAFAYISILEVTLKLLIVFLLKFGGFDRLVMYAVLMFAIQLMIRVIYQWYCVRHFGESRFRIEFDGHLFREMLSFAGWNLWGNLASVMFTQGINLLLNVFFGPVVNAAKAVTDQVNGAVRQFAVNFQMAVNPQITKTYAAGDLQSMHSLIFSSSRITFFLLFALFLPIFLETPFILDLWLKDVPEWTVTFVRILMWGVLLDSVSNPLMTAAAATGNVKLYQSVLGGILLLIVPVAYVVLRMGGNPASVFVVNLVIYGVAFIVRLLIVRPMIGLSLRSYFVKVVAKCVAVCVSASIVPLALHLLLPETALNAVCVISVAVLSVCTLSYTLGLTASERSLVKYKLFEFLHKR